MRDEPKPQRHFAAFSVAFRLWWWWTLFSSLAVAATTTTIQVNRDGKGVWFITGPDDAPLKDVFKAMGHAVAVDRLWQMEGYRRASTGRLAEIYGEDYLEVDIQMRTYGYSGEYILLMLLRHTTEHVSLIQRSLTLHCVLCSHFHLQIPS
jgi:acyl-homoserine lactone acylase PvdQ